VSLDDERVRFYFRHRDQIEEWAALRSEAAAAIDEWFFAMRPDVEALARDLGPGVVLHVIDEAGVAYPSYRLVRDSWPESSNSDPVASVSLEWVRGRTTLRASTSPYVGLRAAKDRALGAPLREAEALRKVRARRKDTTTTWWAAYGYVLPTAAFPEGADEYRSRVLEALRLAWADYAPLVDGLIVSR